MQMNSKVGGTPWVVDKLPFQSETTMICGMDVFRNASLGKKSVFALTASMDTTATIIWSTSVVQDESGEEESTTLQNSMEQALESFKRRNGSFPARIIFYRNSVGEATSLKAYVVKRKEVE